MFKPWILVFACYRRKKITFYFRPQRGENKELGTPENKAAQQDAKEVDHLIQQNQPLVSEIKRLQ